VLDLLRAAALGADDRGGTARTDQLSGFALAYARSARRLGWRSSVAGALAALPSVASVLTVSTHQQHGVDAVLDLLRCMLGGMAAFVLCCALIGLLVEPAAWPPRSSLRPRRPC
jgi:hypothetical protein